ncbi:MAG TPA: aminoglycoside phosphotransferase family protein [Pseudolysinimonas sp.]|nr:aminoglycoside phosphotransferase family protein [Pseudolysinimonas sp.]
MDELEAGGNMNAVRRAGDTVVRTAGVWTPTIHRYLRHLAATGIEWIPRALSIGADHEVLSFVEGEVPLYPLPDWVWLDDALVDAAAHLRALHDASVGFDTEGAIWRVPAHSPVEVICHNDFTPHNLAFEKGRVVGVIDFDTCSPGSRMWDIAYLATRMMPLAAEPPPGTPAGDRSRDRIRLLLDSYGSDADWTEVVQMAIVRLRDLSAFTVRIAAELSRPGLLEDAVGFELDAAHLAGVLKQLP